ncbi:MAG: sulfite exporter TauE/SafE family protein [Terriglobales bacterium]
MVDAHLLALIALGFGAGTFGAVAGVGGGAVVVPVLAAYLGVPMHQAIGVSLVTVISTSTAASSLNVERGVTDIRLGMTLELATTLGAAAAAIIAGFIHRRTLAILFTSFLLYTGLSLIRRAWVGRKLRPTAEVPAYDIHNYPAGLGAGFLAGGISGLLGVGGGIVKVPIMYLVMGIPLRVATATSNFMIGVTATASAFIYWGRGDIVLSLAGPIVLGNFFGSLTGAWLAPKLRSSYVLGILVAVTLYLSAQMILKIATGKI